MASSLPEAFGGNNTSGPIQVATARLACNTATGRLDFGSETFVVQHPETETLIPTIGGGFDVATFAATDYESGAFDAVDVAGPLTTSADRTRAAPIAFSAKDHGADACDDLSPTLRAGGHTGSHANAGVMPAVAFQTRGSSLHVGDISGTMGTNAGDASGGAPMVALAFHENQCAELTTNDTAGSLKTQGGKPGQGYPAVMQAMQVRRLTPSECLALQGFPRNYLDITYRGKPAADGPKYKATGNSWAVPCAAWIGKRIMEVEAINGSD